MKHTCKRLVNRSGRALSARIVVTCGKTGAGIGRRRSRTGSERFERAGFLPREGVCAGSSIIGGEGCERSRPVGFALIETKTSAGLRSASGTDLRRRRAAANSRAPTRHLQLVLAALRA